MSLHEGIRRVYERHAHGVAPARDELHRFPGAVPVREIQDAVGDARRRPVRRDIAKPDADERDRLVDGQHQRRHGRAEYFRRLLASGAVSKQTDLPSSAR